MMAEDALINALEQEGPGDEIVFLIDFDGFFISREGFAEKFFIGLNHMGSISVTVTVRSEKVFAIVATAAKKHGWKLIPNDEPNRYRVLPTDDTQPLPALEGED